MAARRPGYRPSVAVSLDVVVGPGIGREQVWKEFGRALAGFLGEFAEVRVLAGGGPGRVVSREEAQRLAQRLADGVRSYRPGPEERGRRYGLPGPGLERRRQQRRRLEGPRSGGMGRGARPSSWADALLAGRPERGPDSGQAAHPVLVALRSPDAQRELARFWRQPVTAVPATRREFSELLGRLIPPGPDGGGDLARAQSALEDALLAAAGRLIEARMAGRFAYWGWEGVPGWLARAAGMQLAAQLLGPGHGLTGPRLAAVMDTARELAGQLGAALDAAEQLSELAGRLGVPAARFSEARQVRMRRLFGLLALAPRVLERGRDGRLNAADVHGLWQVIEDVARLGPEEVEDLLSAAGGDAGDAMGLRQLARIVREGPADAYGYALVFDASAGVVRALGLLMPTPREREAQWLAERLLGAGHGLTGPQLAAVMDTATQLGGQLGHSGVSTETLSALADQLGVPAAGLFEVRMRQLFVLLALAPQVLEPDGRLSLADVSR